MAQKYKNKFVFIDESGDPNFFKKRGIPLWGREDFVPVMLIGMLMVPDRKTLRHSVMAFQEKILQDPLLNSIYSVRQPNWYLHARNDHSDIILKTFEFIRSLDGLTFFLALARKVPEIFIKKHNRNPSEFYFDVLNKLFELEELDPDNRYHLFLSARQSNTEQKFAQAFERAIEAQEKKSGLFDYRCSVVRSMDFPEMSVVDYLIWAFQRYLLKGERRYLTAVEHHFAGIIDLYEDDGKGRIYGKGEAFTLEKASPIIKKR